MRDRGSGVTAVNEIRFVNNALLPLFSHIKIILEMQKAMAENNKIYGGLKNFSALNMATSRLSSSTIKK